MQVRGIAAGAGVAAMVGFAVFTATPAAAAPDHAAVVASAARPATSGGCWVVTGNGVKYHSRPGLGGGLGEVNRGQKVNDLARSQSADGILWNNVNIAGG